MCTNELAPNVFAVRLSPKRGALSSEGGGKRGPCACTGALRGARVHRRFGASGSLGISSLGVLALLAAAPSVGPLLVVAAAVSPSPCRRLLVGAVASAGSKCSSIVDVISSWC
jgi:hypothetical protein